MTTSDNPTVLFVVVNGVPSVGVQVMVGSGQIGEQPTNAAVALPDANIIAAGNNGASSGSSAQGNQGHNTSAAGGLRDSLTARSALFVSGLLSLTVLASFL